MSESVPTLRSFCRRDSPDQDLVRYRANARQTLRGSCNDGRPKPRFSKVRRNRHASGVQIRQSRSKNTQPRGAWRPLVSVISEPREIIGHHQKAARRPPSLNKRAEKYFVPPSEPEGEICSRKIHQACSSLDPAILKCLGAAWHCSSPAPVQPRNNLRIPPRSFTIPFIALGERFRNSSNRALIRTINSSSSSIRSYA
jgi:hypothetical protein